LPEPPNEADHDAYWRPLGQLLVERGLLRSDELEAALDEQERTGGKLGEILLRDGLLSRLALMSSLHEQSLSEPADTSFGSGLRSALGGTDSSAHEATDEPEVEGGFGSGLRDALARHDESD
jgi:hypothetical protein